MHDRLRLRRSSIKYTAFLPQRLIQQIGRVGLSDPAASAGVGDGFPRAADGAMVFLGGDG